MKIDDIRAMIKDVYFDLESIVDEIEPDYEEFDKMRESYDFVAVNGGIDALKNRLLPEGMEWPRFEDGEPVRLGDMVELNSKVAKVCGVFISKHGFTLWGESGDDTGSDTRFDYLDGKRAKRAEPCTIGADGLPIKNGDTVYVTCEGGPYKVINVSDKGSVFIDAFPDMGMHGSMFTHTKPEMPDSWDKWKKDATMYTAYNGCGYDWPFSYVREVLGKNIGAMTTVEAQQLTGDDLERRANALLKKENN